MADRPQRGAGGSRGGFRGRGGGGGRGRGDSHSGGGRGDHHSGGGDRDRPKKENILDLARYMDKEVQVKFNGGREGTVFHHPHPHCSSIPRRSFHFLPRPTSKRRTDFPAENAVTGTLKGYDALMNLVLDDVKETMRDDDGNETSRPLGLVVIRGTLLVALSPTDGSEPIANPFVQHDEEE
ncbi:hypothetical protein RB594_006321 [Gaeumannomyces avenae]